MSGLNNDRWTVKADGVIHHHCGEHGLSPNSDHCVACGKLSHKHELVAPIRTFATGATRDQDTTKHDPEGFLSPLVIARYNAYMHKNRVQADGSLRDSDNWQKGIPREAYMKSAWRHTLDWWMHHRGWPGQAREGLEDALCAVLFNAMGYLDVVLRARLSASGGPLPEGHPIHTISNSTPKVAE